MRHERRAAVHESELYPSGSQRPACGAGPDPFADMPLLEQVCQLMAARVSYAVGQQNLLSGEQLVGGSVRTCSAPHIQWERAQPTCYSLIT